MMSVQWTLTGVTRTATTLSEVTGAAAILGTPSTVTDAHAMVCMPWRGCELLDDYILYIM